MFAIKATKSLSEGLVNANFLTRFLASDLDECFFSSLINSRENSTTIFLFLLKLHLKIKYLNLETLEHLI